MLCAYFLALIFQKINIVQYKLLALVKFRGPGPYRENYSKIVSQMIMNIN